MIAAAVPFMATEPREDGVKVEITRKALCQCGVEFRQFRLANAWLRWLRGARPAAFELVKAALPDYYTPTHCPRCERVLLATEPRVVDAFDHARYALPQPSQPWLE
jgi:hypothetical protein